MGLLIGWGVRHSCDAARQSWGGGSDRGVGQQTVGAGSGKDGAERQRRQCCRRGTSPGSRPGHAPRTGTVRGQWHDAARLGACADRSRHDPAGAGIRRPCAGLTTMTQTLGWVATALFAGSYFARPSALRAIQMVAAVLWVVYGILIAAVPVI